MAAVAAVTALALPGAATAKAPSRAQIRAALSAAKRSRQLWATINICNTPQHKDQLGIRGEMPSLGFRTQMSMIFEVTYRLAASGAFTPLPSTKATLPVGQASNKALQVGRTYPFQPSAATLAGRVTFIWKRDKRVLGAVTRMTTGNHHHVDFADPPGYSQATCTIS